MFTSCLSRIWPHPSTTIPTLMVIEFTMLVDPSLVIIVSSMPESKEEDFERTNLHDLALTQQSLLRRSLNNNFGRSFISKYYYMVSFSAICCSAAITAIMHLNHMTTRPCPITRTPASEVMKFTILVASLQVITTIYSVYLIYVQL